MIEPQLYRHTDNRHHPRKQTNRATNNKPSLGIRTIDDPQNQAKQTKTLLACHFASPLRAPPLFTQAHHAAAAADGQGDGLAPKCPGATGRLLAHLPEISGVSWRHYRLPIYNFFGGSPCLAALGFRAHFQFTPYLRKGLLRRCPPFR